MTTPVSLVDIHHHTVMSFFLSDENFYDLLSQQLLNVQYSITNGSHHVAGFFNYVAVDTVGK